MSARAFYKRKTKPALWTTIWPPEKTIEPPRYLRHTSKRRDAVNRLYLDRREDYIAGVTSNVVTADRCCPVMKTLYGAMIYVDQVHHIRGRNATLLLDKRFWMPVCLAGHQWIDANRDQARKHGWLCEVGQFNTPVAYDDTMHYTNVYDPPSGLTIAQFQWLLDLLAKDGVDIDTHEALTAAWNAIHKSNQIDDIDNAPFEKLRQWAAHLETKHKTAKEAAKWR